MKAHLPQLSPQGPENARRFAPAHGRVADLFQTYLAFESVVSRPIDDDLRLGRTFAALPPPPAQDRSEKSDDGPDAALGMLEA